MKFNETKESTMKANIKIVVTEEGGKREVLGEYAGTEEDAVSYWVEETGELTWAPQDCVEVVPGYRRAPGYRAIEVPAPSHKFPREVEREIVAALNRIAKKMLLEDLARDDRAPAPAPVGRFEVKCDDCRQTIRHTDSVRESAAGGRCDACKGTAARVEELARFEPASALEGWAAGYRANGDTANAELCEAALELQASWRSPRSAS